MKVIGQTLCGYFPVGFHQGFSSVHLLVITDLRLRECGVSFHGPFMDIRLRSGRDL